MAEAARLRGPDIILRTAPPLSATSDAPLAEVPQIPASASNDPADLAAGVTPEISPQQKAEAVRDKNEPTPNALDSKAGDQEGDKGDADPEIDRIQIDGKDVPLPPWMKREITKARNRQRDAEATSKQAADALEALRAEVEALKAKATQPTETEVPAKQTETQGDPRPTRDQFDDPESYDDALTTWATREGERKAAEKIAAERAEADAKTKQAQDEAAKAETEARITKLNADWTERTIKAAERYADFKQVAEGDHEVTNDMALVILHADNGPDIAYFLGKNPEESARIAALPTPLQGHELGKIAARLAAPQARAPRQRPLEPIEGGNGPADTSGREESMEEVAKRVNSRYAANRRPFISAETTRRQ